MKTLSKTLILLLFFAQYAAAAVVGFSVEPQTAEISAEKPAQITLKLSVKDGWHIYGKSAQTGSPTVFDFSLPKGFRLDSLEWQPEKTFEFMGAKFGGYDGEVLVKAKISATENVDTPKNFSVKVSASWLACSDTCVPESASAGFELLQIPAEKPSAPSPEISESDGAKAGFFAVLAAAFLGGLILNLMPCVFPVLGIKIISFAKSANGSRSAAVLNALCYAGGIVATFLLLAAVLLGLRSGGESLGWGFQLQNPIFSSLMALLFFAMALSFAGVFEIGAGLTGFAGVGGHVANKYAQAALSGALAVLVASPCTAPFMGSALGVALSGGVSAWESLAVFVFLGLGMASPYVVLSAMPNAKKYLPKAGAWMERLKQILSIPLFATVAWLVWLYGRQTESLGYILAALFVLAAGLRVYGVCAQPHRQRTTRRSAIVAALLAVAVAIGLCVTGTRGDNAAAAPAENAWSTEKVARLRAEGKSVYVDFTAAWCLTCQYNKTVLYSPKIERLFAERGVKMLVADWTNKDETIARELEKYGRAGVPLNLLFPPKGEAAVLPAVLTEQAVIEAVDKIK